MQSLFLVETGGGLGQTVQQPLERAGFLVHVLSADTSIIQRALRVRPLLIMIETSVGEPQALELCRRIRETASLARTPVVLLAPASLEEERVAALESGADHYISDFSNPRELVARMQAVVRRFSRRPPFAGAPRPSAFFPLLSGRASTIRAGDIEINASAMRISVLGSETPTTTLEFRLLYYLLHHRTCVVTRDQLLDAVWGTQDVSPRTVDACVRRLRYKIERDRSSPIYLKTIRGAGYCLETRTGQT